jgi:hypothetical protein
LGDLARYRNKFYTDTCTHSDLLLGGTVVTIESSLEKLLPGFDMATTLFKPILLQKNDTSISYGVQVGGISLQNSNRTCLRPRKKHD